MNDDHDRDVLFPWEIERVRRSAEAEAAQTDTDAGATAHADAADAGSGAEQDADEAGAGSGEAGAGSGEADAGSGEADVEQTDIRAEDVKDDSAVAAVQGGAEPEAADEGPAAAAARDDDDDRFAVLDTPFARRAAERATAALRDKPIAQKEYYSISEVCELVGLKPHVLRYWETQFQVLNPSKNRSGNRVYQRKEIRLITLVKHLLYEEKYTVEGAKAKLDQLRRGRELTDATGVVLDRSMVEQLRADLSELASLLAPPPAQG